VKVRCVSRDSWLRVGHEYVVLELFGRGSSLKYRVVGNDRLTPALHDSNLFEMTDRAVPSGWTFQLSDNEWVLGPKEWSSTGFWTAFFDGDKSARHLFRLVLSSLETHSD
jgi:hypothetical protein